MNFTHTANPVPVLATPIIAVETIAEGAMLSLGDGTIFFASHDMLARYSPVAGDYLVTQEDGYQYVNPKAVFDRKYSPIKDGDMPDYQQRVINERDELSEKIDKLSAFLQAATAKNLVNEEQLRLGHQLDTMRLYCTILNQRIDAFPTA